MGMGMEEGARPTAAVEGPSSGQAGQTLAGPPGNGRGWGWGWAPTRPGEEGGARGDAVPLHTGRQAGAVTCAAGGGGDGAGRGRGRGKLLNPGCGWTTTQLESKQEAGRGAGTPFAALNHERKNPPRTCKNAIQKVQNHSHSAVLWARECFLEPANSELISSIITKKKTLGRQTQVQNGTNLQVQFSS